VPVFDEANPPNVDGVGLLENINTIPPDEALVIFSVKFQKLFLRSSAEPAGS